MPRMIKLIPAQINELKRRNWIAENVIGAYIYVNLEKMILKLPLNENIAYYQKRLTEGHIKTLQWLKWIEPYENDIALICLLKLF